MVETFQKVKTVHPLVANVGADPPTHTGAMVVHVIVYAVPSLIIRVIDEPSGQFVGETGVLLAVRVHR